MAVAALATGAANLVFICPPGLMARGRVVLRQSVVGDCDGSVLSNAWRSVMTTAAKATTASRQAAIATSADGGRARAARHASQCGLGVGVLRDRLGRRPAGGRGSRRRPQGGGCRDRSSLGSELVGERLAASMQVDSAVDTEQPRRSAISGVERSSR